MLSNSFWLTLDRGWRKISASHWIRLWPNQKTFFRINICTCFVKNQAVADVDAKTVCKVYSKTKRNIEHLILWRWVLCCANKSVHRLCVHLKRGFLSISISSPPSFSSSIIHFQLLSCSVHIFMIKLFFFSLYFWIWYCSYSLWESSTPGRWACPLHWWGRMHLRWIKDHHEIKNMYSSTPDHKWNWVMMFAPLLL